MALTAGKWQNKHLQDNYKHDFTATEMNVFIIFTEKITIFTKLVKTGGKSGVLLYDTVWLDYFLTLPL